MLTTVVRPLLRLAIAALLAISGLVLAGAAPAAACSCKAIDVAQQTGRADAVFVAKVDGATKTENRTDYAVTATRVYTGTVERKTTVTVAKARSDCDLGQLQTGTEYVFLVDGATAPLAVTSASCGLTGPATDKRIAEVEDVLGPGTAIEAPVPPPPTMTRVETSAPASTARLAAPGGAFILIGFLGLLLVRRRARG